MKRLAVIDREHCVGPSNKCNRVCVPVCPVVRMGADAIFIGEDGYARINEDLCIGCLLCVKKCPVKVISVVNLPGEEGDPTFQYGENTFRLYGLVLPKSKSVVGLIGVNGIGKSTALELLTGKLRPNFGHYEKTLSAEEIKKAFRGQEVQDYLEKLEAKSVRVAYKIQHVDILAKAKGTAGELLRACQEQRSDTDYLALLQELEVDDLQDRELSQLSGGELQRVAIACTLLRDAVVYFFDEYSSYLDIRQRLRLAHTLRNVAEEKSVVLVEHDLALLDYLSDFVHVLYGEKGVYGKISQLKSVKNGINEYLDGLLREENIRFRKESIKFNLKSPTIEIGKKAFDYPALKKQFKQFALSTDTGFVNKGEIVGLVGANGIGKTTFIKLLAGVEHPDEGQSLERKRVAYKPQYVTSDFDGSVAELLASLNLQSAIHENEVGSRLEIPPLTEKQVKNLSGGELQRVSIAINLAQPADVRLLDEPSSFLDVEQRLNAADAIKRVAQATGAPTFVVDHDVLFIDSVSDRLIVFDGKSGVNGHARAPLPLREGMNAFLKEMDLTFRRDPQTGRPRANKPGSVLDREQKEKGEYYYTQ